MLTMAPMTIRRQMFALVAGVLLICPTVFGQGHAVGEASDQGYHETQRPNERQDQGYDKRHHKGLARSRLQVFVSILPLKYFVDNVGGLFPWDHDPEGEGELLQEAD